MKLYSTIDTNLDNVSLQSALDRLHQWCNHMLMLANAMYCTLVNLIIIIAIFFNGCHINDACIVSDLGIEINSSVKYDAHINEIVAKACWRSLQRFYNQISSSLKESILNLRQTCPGIRFQCMGTLSN